MTPIWIHHISPTISTVGHRPPPRSAKQTGSRHPHLSRSRNHIIINYIVALSLGESCRHLNLLLFLLILLITTDGGQPLPGDTRGSLLPCPPSYATAKMNYIFHPYMNHVHLPTCNVLKKKIIVISEMSLKHQCGMGCCPVGLVACSIRTILNPT